MTADLAVLGVAGCVRLLRALRWSGLLLLVGIEQAVAQDRRADPLPRWEVTPCAGGASTTHVTGGWGRIPGLGQYLIGVHAVAPVLRVGVLPPAYAPDVAPLYVLTTSVRRVSFGNSIEISRGPVAAAGVSPLGIEVGLGHPGDRLRAFAGGAVGALWFQRAVPEPTAAAYNDTYQYDLGASVRVGSATRVRVAWRYHHLSNLYRAPSNPGVDGRFGWLGLARRF